MSILKFQNVRILCQPNTKLCKLWTYVAIAFNKVDESRLELVGPDRLCAEWVLKNSGAVAFTKAPNKFLKDYNLLPPENVKFNIAAIDGSNSSIMKIGLDHLKNCNNIENIIINNCKHLEEDALQNLFHVKKSLKHLQVSSCDNISDEGLLPIKDLTNLISLKIFKMRYVKNIDKVIDELSSHLKNCQISRTQV